MSRCQVCGARRVTVLLDLGVQPVCNRFLTSPTEHEYRHDLVLGQCQACGLVQLVSPFVPAAELRPRYDWVTYREPEEHLDRLAETICQLPGLGRRPTAAGISFKDDSLLARLASRGFRTWRVDPAGDLGIEGHGAGVETIQDRLDAQRSAELVERHGQPDVLIARHILEHAQDLRRFTQALRALLGPTGSLVLEVPDCTPALDTCDYTTLWEEHTVSFTPQTFRGCCHRLNLAVSHVEAFPYAMENSLVAIGQFRGDLAGERLAANALEQELARAQVFAKQLGACRTLWQQRLTACRESRGRIAVFGAGHLSCTFLNVMGTSPWVEFVVDDHPNKQGLFMSGSHLPIRGSSALLSEGIRLCLLGMGPEGEDRLIQRQALFIERGGVFASLLLASKRTLANIMEPDEDRHVVQAVH